jgi:hypothetical protein
MMARAQAFLRKHSQAKDDMEWCASKTKRIRQKESDSQSLDEQTAAADIIKEDLMGLRDVEKKQRCLTKDECVSLCRWYVYYRVRDWEIPESVSQHITAANYDKYFPETLRKEAE